MHVKHGNSILYLLLLLEKIQVNHNKGLMGVPMLSKRELLLGIFVFVPNNSPVLEKTDRNQK